MEDFPETMNEDFKPTEFNEFSLKAQISVQPTSIPDTSNLDFKKIDMNIPKKRFCLSFKTPKIQGDIPKNNFFCCSKKSKTN